MKNAVPKMISCAVAVCACVTMLVLCLSGGWLPTLACAAIGLSQRGGTVEIQATAPTAALNGTTSPFGSEDSQDIPPTTVATTTVTATGRVAGKVVETVLPVGSSFIQGVAIRNRSGTALDIAKELAAPVGLTLAQGEAPQVLIYHTHTTESYMPYFNGTYREGEAARTTDEHVNICAVGEAIAAKLRQAGIGVIHDTTIHDKPYTGAYSRSEATVKALLEKHPTVSVVIDVHRDGVMIDETTKSKPTVTINGRKAAQLMIICGATSTDAIPSPHWRTNLRLSMQVQQNLSQKYGQLMRQMSVVSSRYNQHLGKAAFLVEVGSEGNTLEEALYSAELFGRALAEELNALR